MKIKLISPDYSQAAFVRIRCLQTESIRLTPKFLIILQKYIQEKIQCGEKPIRFVFHGGSSFYFEEIRSYFYGVIKNEY